MNEKDLVQFTEYMNAKVLKDKIKFTLEHSETELVFLDTKVHLKNLFSETARHQEKKVFRMHLNLSNRH